MQSEKKKETKKAENHRPRVSVVMLTDVSRHCCICMPEKSRKHVHHPVYNRVLVLGDNS